MRCASGATCIGLPPTRAPAPSPETESVTSAPSKASLWTSAGAAAAAAPPPPPGGRAAEEEDVGGPPPQPTNSSRSCHTGVSRAAESSTPKWLKLTSMLPPPQKCSWCGSTCVAGPVIAALAGEAASLDSPGASGPPKASGEKGWWCGPKASSLRDGRREEGPEADVAAGGARSLGITGVGNQPWASSDRNPSCCNEWYSKGDSADLDASLGASACAGAALLTVGNAS